MTDLWTPSDELLKADPVAQVKVDWPFDPPDLADAGVVLPDLEDDDANEEAAAVALTVISEDEDSDEGGECDDDDALDEPDDDGSFDDV